VAERGWQDLKEIKPTPPNKTYAKRMDLKVGTHDVQLLFLGRGHTNGDTFVLLPKERIVCTGDMLESVPSYMGDGQFDEWVATLGELHKLEFDMILPGHGRPMMGKTIIPAYQAYLTDLTNQVASLRKQGLTADQTAERVDLTAHKATYPNIQRPGADLRGVRRVYEWMDERGRK
jgi:glyoxylase-like metal-dependent hydrolase (beta-lactamase superfamily II)